LDLDDGFGLLKPLAEPGVFLIGLGQFGGDGVGSCAARPALERFERGVSAGVALPAPVRQGRRVKAFTAQNGGDPAGVSRAVGFRQDAELCGSREGPALRPRRQFR